MIITCEYCGAELDTDNCDVCPLCGGTFQNNKDYIARKAREEEADRLNMEQKKIDLEKQKQAKIAEQVIMLRTEIVKNSDGSQQKADYLEFIRKVIGIIIMLIFLITFVSSCIADKFADEGDDGYSNSNSLNYTVMVENNTNNDTIVEEPVTVNYRAQAKMSQYTVMCDSFVEVNNSSMKTTLGDKCVSFHFVVTNTSANTIKTEPMITCKADGNICDEMANNIFPTLPKEIEAGEMVTGNVIFRFRIMPKHLMLSMVIMSQFILRIH